MARFCTKCGASLPDDAGFCNKCGARVIAPEQPEKEKKSKSKIYLIIGLCIACVAIIVGGIFIIRNMSKSDKTPDLPIEVETPDEDSNKPKDDNKIVAPGGERSGESIGGTALPSGKTGAATTDPGTTQTIDSVDDVTGLEPPKYEDFDWYLSDVMYNGKPKDSKKLLAESRCGEWKCLLIWGDVLKSDRFKYDLCYATILDKEGSDAEIYFDWYQYFYEPGKVYDSTQEVETFLVTESLDGYMGEYPYYINMLLFYEYDGMQYAVGTIINHDDVPATVLLMR